MSNFHASIRDILEDVYRFLVISSQKEVISNSSENYKESLLNRIKSLDNEYPELHLNLYDANERNSVSFSPSSNPFSYIDMNGSSQYKSLFHSANVDKDNYDICSPKDKYDSLENQSITESEDYTSEEAKHLPEVSASDLYACEKSGYLDKKKRESIKGWLNPFQKRWCAIKEGVLYYYEKTTDRKQKGNIVLSGYEARTVSEDNKDGKKYSHCFELVCPGRRTYQFSAPSEKDLKQWITAIEHNNQSSSSGKSTNSNPKVTNSLLAITNDTNTEAFLNDHNLEDIYETVEEEELLNANEKKSEDIKESKESISVSSVEDNNKDQLFNYNEWYVGLWDCSGADDTELTFDRGDLIHVVSKEYDNFAWWVGELQGKIGFVPKSYLMEAYEAC